jgi:protein ImuA
LSLQQEENHMPRDPTLSAAGPSLSLRSSAQQIEDLRAYLRRAEQSGLSSGKTVPAISFGIPGVDGHLPAGGLARGALHEMVADTHGDMGAVTDFCIAVLVRLFKTCPRSRERTILWCLQNQAMDAGDLYPPGFSRLGLDPAHVLAVRAKHDADVLWVMEEALRCPALGAVVGEVRTADLTASRRLQLAAEAGGITALLLRPSSSARASNVLGPSAATTRWRIAAGPSNPRGWMAGLNEPGAVCWQATLFRCRGGAPANWLMEWCDETGDLALAAPVRNRPDRPCDASLAG